MYVNGKGWNGVGGTIGGRGSNGAKPGGLSTYEAIGGVGASVSTGLVYLCRSMSLYLASSMAAGVLAAGVWKAGLETCDGSVGPCACVGGTFGGGEGEAAICSCTRLMSSSNQASFSSALAPGMVLAPTIAVVSVLGS